MGGVCGDEVGDVGEDFDAGVDACEMEAGGFGFRESGAGVVFVEEHLALEVGGLDEVAIDEGEMTDAGAGEEAGRGGSGGTDADDGDAGAAEILLAGLTDAGEEDLAGVAFAVGDGEGGRGADGVRVYVCSYGGLGGKRRHASKYTVRTRCLRRGWGEGGEPGESFLHL